MIKTESGGMRQPVFKGLRERINRQRNILIIYAHTKFRLELITWQRLDPNQIRRMKANGDHTMAESSLDGEGRNNKKQSGNRHKCGNDK